MPTLRPHLLSGVSWRRSRRPSSDSGSTKSGKRFGRFRDVAHLVQPDRVGKAHDARPAPRRPAPSEVDHKSDSNPRLVLTMRSPRWKQKQAVGARGQTMTRDDDTLEHSIS